MRTGVCSTAWTYLTGRSRRRLRKKEKKKIDKVRFFTSLGRRRRAARAPVSSAPSPQARAMIEYHKCRVSSFSNWASIPVQKSTSRRPRFTSLLAQGKAASPEKLKHEAAVAALTAQIQLIELEASQRDPLF